MRRAPSPPWPPLRTGLSISIVFRIVFGSDLGRAVGIDPLLEDCRRLEHHHAPRRYRHFLAGLGVPADSLALLANHKRTKRRQFHGLASLKAVRDFLQDQLDQCR